MIVEKDFAAVSVAAFVDVFSDIVYQLWRSGSEYLEAVLCCVCVQEQEQFGRLADVVVYG